MVVSHILRYVYLPVPKTGTTSVFFVLRNLFSGVIEGECFPERHCMVGSGKYDYFKFATVRNPYTRAISLWQHFKYVSFLKSRGFEVKGYPDLGLGLSFSSFLDILLDGFRHWIVETQCSLLSKRKVDVFVHVEKLEEGFNSLPFVKEDVYIPMENVGCFQICVADLSGIEKVVQWAEMDFEMFDYSQRFDTREYVFSLKSGVFDDV